jgi:hypothetical protein
MKAIGSALLLIFLLGPAWAAKPAEDTPMAGPETTLNAAAHYLDSIFTNTLAGLELIASTPEAKRGEWNGIKNYLGRMEARLPGVYFFVLPDGNYYSVAKDYTNLNLADRAYFNTLLAGHQVKGFPLYSRSSGKKSALMAVPIMVDNKMTGAIGASVFLDELHNELNRAFALPANYTWFVLDPMGKVMLDRDSDFIFMSPLTQGSKSLQEGVARALNSESGTMQYEQEGIKHAHYRRLPNMDWWMFLARIEAPGITTPPQLRLSLEHFVPSLQKTLDQIDASLAGLMEDSGVNITHEAEMRSLLASVISANPSVVNAAFIDAAGVMRHIEPSEYKNFENVDISTQAQVVAMQKKPAPIFSGGFTAVEGFLAVDLARPVYDDEKNFAGSISALLRPELLIGGLLKDITIPADYELWIMQPDGLIIYDQDTDEIGRMLFSDPAYAGYETLLKLGKQIGATPAGEGSYIFVAPDSKAKVIKNAVWQTVRLHHQEWRVVLAYQPYTK